MSVGVDSTQALALLASIPSTIGESFERVTMNLAFHNLEIPTTLVFKVSHNPPIPSTLCYCGAAMTDHRTWYNSLDKPTWTPRSQTIGRIWSLLYPIIIACTIWTIVAAANGTASRWALVAMALNLASNIAFTPIQFGLRRLGMATIDILIVVVSLAWWIMLVLEDAPWLAVALVPYLVWVSIATVIMINIWARNR